MRRYQNVLRKQLYLQQHGVSFDYTDKQTSKQLDDLINVCMELDKQVEELHNNNDS